MLLLSDTVPTIKAKEVSIAGLRYSPVSCGVPNIKDDDNSGQRSKINKNKLLEWLEETIDKNNIVTKLDVIIDQLKSMTEKNESQEAEIRGWKALSTTSRKSY